jgi:hypothetical protein
VVKTEINVTIKCNRVLKYNKRRNPWGFRKHDQVLECKNFTVGSFVQQNRIIK